MRLETSGEGQSVDGAQPSLRVQVSILLDRPFATAEEHEHLQAHEGRVLEMCVVVQFSLHNQEHRARSHRSPDVEKDPCGLLVIPVVEHLAEDVDVSRGELVVPEIQFEARATVLADHESARTDSRGQRVSIAVDQQDVGAGSSAPMLVASDPVPQPTSATISHDHAFR